MGQKNLTILDVKNGTTMDQRTNSDSTNKSNNTTQKSSVVESLRKEEGKEKTIKSVEEISKKIKGIFDPYSLVYDADG